MSEHYNGGPCNDNDLASLQAGMDRFLDALGKLGNSLKKLEEALGKIGEIGDAGDDNVHG